MQMTVVGMEVKSHLMNGVFQMEASMRVISSEKALQK